MSEPSKVYGRETCEDAEAGAAFERWARDLQLFAERHHLTVWRYPQRASTWMFHFLHPAGGFCFLQLHCVRPKETYPLEAWVSAHWYIDDYEKGLRWEPPYRESVKAGDDVEAIVSTLEGQLDILVRTPRSELVPSACSFVPTGDGRGNFSASDFERGLRVPV
jgi:hypothetical protein